MTRYHRTIFQIQEFLYVREVTSCVIMMQLMSVLVCSSIGYHLSLVPAHHIITSSAGKIVHSHKSNNFVIEWISLSGCLIPYFRCTTCPSWYNCTSWNRYRYTHFKLTRDWLFILWYYSYIYILSIHSIKFNFDLT